MLMWPLLLLWLVRHIATVLHDNDDHDDNMLILMGTLLEVGDG